MISPFGHFKTGLKTTFVCTCKPIQNPLYLNHFKEVFCKPAKVKAVSKPVSNYAISIENCSVDMDA